MLHYFYFVYPGYVFCFTHLSINVRERRRSNQEMDNPDKLATLGAQAIG
jgi:hypothetical protein